jgi:hypothetical protein
MLFNNSGVGAFADTTPRPPSFIKRNVETDASRRQQNNLCSCPRHLQTLQDLKCSFSPHGKIEEQDVRLSLSDQRDDFVVVPRFSYEDEVGLTGEKLAQDSSK